MLTENILLEVFSSKYTIKNVFFKAVNKII